MRLLLSWPFSAPNRLAYYDLTFNILVSTAQGRGIQSYCLKTSVVAISVMLHETRPWHLSTFVQSRCDELCLESPESFLDVRPLRQSLNPLYAANVSLLGYNWGKEISKLHPQGGGQLELEYFPFFCPDLSLLLHAIGRDIF